MNVLLCGAARSVAVVYCACPGSFSNTNEKVLLVSGKWNACQEWVALLFNHFVYLTSPCIFNIAVYI